MKQEETSANQQSSIDKYVAKRLDGQQKWYSDKSGKNRKLYERIKFVTIVLAVLIPLISSFENYFPENFSATLSSGIIGAILAVLTSASGFMKFQEKWINYRTASERLKSEKEKWHTKTDPYDKTGADQLLVKRVEGIILSEHGDWTEYMSKSPEEEEK